MTVFSSSDLTEVAVSLVPWFWIPQGTASCIDILLVSSVVISLEV